MALVLAVDDTPDCLEPLAKLLRLGGHTWNKQPMARKRFRSWSDSTLIV
jgi:hypothetical protein